MIFTRLLCSPAKLMRCLPLEETVRTVREMGIFAQRACDVQSCLTDASSPSSSPHMTEFDGAAVPNAHSASVSPLCVTNFVADPLKPFTRIALCDMTARSAGQPCKRLHRTHHAMCDPASTSRYCSGVVNRRWSRWDGCAMSVSNSAHVEGVVQSVQISSAMFSRSRAQSQNNTKAGLYGSDLTFRTRDDNDMCDSSARDGSAQKTECENNSVACRSRPAAVGHQRVGSVIDTQAAGTTAAETTATSVSDLFVVQLVLNVRNDFDGGADCSIIPRHDAPVSVLLEEDTAPIVVRGYMRPTAIQVQIESDATLKAYSAVKRELHTSMRDSSKCIDTTGVVVNTNATNEKKLAECYKGILEKKLLQRRVIVSGELRMMHLYDNEVNCVVDVPFIFLPCNAMTSHCRTIE